MLKITHSYDLIEIKWISRKYANFLYGKIYLARAKSIIVGTQKFTDFTIKDEDGDNYTLSGKDVNKKFEILTPGVGVE